jgi:hypothetical protein
MSGIAAWNDPDLSQLSMYEPRVDVATERLHVRNLHFFTAVDAVAAVMRRKGCRSDTLGKSHTGQTQHYHSLYNANIACQKRSTTQEQSK